MRTFSLLFLLCSTGNGAQLAARNDTASLVFTHITVIDAAGSLPKSDMSVVISGRRIARIGKTALVEIPRGARVVDAHGKFLIPGLWDMHVHSGGYEAGKQNLPKLLALGITGVRDMGSPLDEILRLRAAVNEGRLAGPRMVIAGPLLQGPLPFKSPLIMSVATDSEAKAAVRFLKTRGVDFIKVHDALPANLYSAVASESKRQRIPFAGHVPPSVGALEASKVGQRSIEHLGGRFYGVLLSCSSREAELTDRMRSTVARVLESLYAHKEPDDSEIFRSSFTKPLVASFDPGKARALLRTFKSNGTWQVPTLIGQPIRDAVNGGRKDLASDDIRYGRMLVQQQLDVVGMMSRAGVKLMAGTDLPLDHPRLHDELALLVQAGLTPLQALQSATRNPAVFLGMLDSLGTIEQGKIADLVVLDADPLADIHNSEKIRAVLVAGRFVDTAWVAKTSPVTLKANPARAFRRVSALTKAAATRDLETVDD
jgi:hypothetical protein